MAGEKFARECVRWIITDVFSFSDDIGLPTGGLKTNKEIARTIFGQRIFKLKEFEQMQDMMKKMSGGGMMKMMKRMGGMKGMPKMPF